MSRAFSLNLLASALTILAAIMLLGSAAFVGGAPGVVPTEMRSRAVVERFYTAVNEVLRTGDSSALASVISANFIIHTPPPGLTPDRDGLRQYLSSIRMSVPGTQLRVEELVVAADHGLARVAVRSDGPGTFLGLQVAAMPPLWGPFDAFRIADGRVSEWWSSAAGAILFEPLQQAPLDLWSSDPQALSLERLISPPGEDWSIGPLVEPRVICVTAGALTVTVDSASTAALRGFLGEHQSPRTMTALREPTVTLQAGEALSLPVGARYTLTHQGSQPDPHAVAVGFPRFPYTGPLPFSSTAPLPAAEGEPTTDSTSMRREGTQAQFIPVVSEASIEFPENATAVSLGRLNIPPGEAISLRELAGPLILVVEEGTLTWDTRKRTKERRHGGNGVSAGTTSDTLDVGKGAILPMGEPIELWATATEPTTVMVITVLSDQSSLRALS